MEIKTRLLRQPWLTALWTLALAAAFGLLLTGAGLLPGRLAYPKPAGAAVHHPGFGRTG